MIERVARAIYEAGEKSVHEVHPGRLAPSPPWDEARKDARIEYPILQQARAAVEAMREPTAAMLKAPEGIMGGGFMNSHSDLETWHAMIDEALKS